MFEDPRDPLDPAARDLLVQHAMNARIFFLQRLVDLRERNYARLNNDPIWRSILYQSSSRGGDRLRLRHEIFMETVFMIIEPTEAGLWRGLPGHPSWR